MLTDNVLKNRHLLNRCGFLDNPATGLSSIALSMMLAEEHDSENPVFSSLHFARLLA